MTFLQAREVDHHVKGEEAFQLACYSGHLEVAQWVYLLGGVDHHAEDERAFRRA